jgi:LysM repeat protein
MENMGMNAGGPDAEVKNLLLQGFRAAKENRREEAYQIFCDVVARDPNNEYGWLYRAATTDSRSEAYVCLEKVLSINPNNEKAQRGLKRIQEQQQEETDSETDSGGYQTAAEAGRIGSAEYVSDTNRAAQPRGVYEAPAPSAYPYGGDDRPSSYPGNFDRPVVPPPPPPPASGYGSMADTQPRPSYDNNYYGNNAGPSVPPPAVPDFPDNEASAQDATRDRLRRGRNKKAGAVIGADPNTDLDENGRKRQGRARNALLIPLLLLLLIVLILGGFFLATRNNNGTDQAGLGNAATSTVQASGTGASAGTTTVAGGTGAVTAGGAAATSGAATTAASGTGATTAASNTGATTAASGNAGTGTTAAGGTSTTAAAGGTNTTAAPAATTAAPASTTAAPANSPVVAQPGNPGSGTAVSTRPVIYTVVRGDNLIRIANQFGTSPDAIRAANRYTQPITGDAIFAGNRYIIPVSRPDFRGSGHIVAQGDTLASIASKYNTTADAIIKLNGLAGPDDIKPGDPLLIP